MQTVSFSKLDDGTWGLKFSGDLDQRIPYGDVVTVRKADGSVTRAKVGAKVMAWNGGRAVVTRVAR